MAQLSDFISRIFSADRTQGLSGGAEVVLDQDPAAAFYASRLRKHRTDEDLVGNPEFLWATSSYQGRKGGLRAHVQSERGEGAVGFVDVLVILNAADAERAEMGGGEVWMDRAARGLVARLEAWAQKEGVGFPYPARPVQVLILPDGSEQMGGQSFGLGPGEYITGLVPNLYLAPGPASRPVLAVHLNLPGVWEGYREVGRLYDDQLLFTLGRHWLDNVSHPALREPGLYRLQQYADGSLVHVISPEAQDRFLVRSDQVSGGASVLTIAEWSGEPVAYLVLAVVDLEAEAAEPAPAPAPAPVEEALRGPAPTPMRESRQMSGRTVVPGALEGRILTMQERGALLQKVHFANFMEGYDVYIGAGGRVATQMAEPKAVLQVRGARVSLLVNDSGVLVGGRPPTLHRSTPLRGEVSIEVDGCRLVYRDLTDVKADGWPYLGELRRPGAGAYLEFGANHRIGRDRRCKVRLPDEAHNDNIAWLPSVGGGTAIRSRTGDIPKSRFYTDSIMVASEHAEVDLGADPTVRSLARHCYTYVRRGHDILTLYPREGAGGRQELPLEPNDELLVGNCLFQVAWVAPGQLAEAAAAVAAPEAPRPPLRPADLAAAVDTSPPDDRPGIHLPPPPPLPPPPSAGRPAPSAEALPPPSLPPPSLIGGRSPSPRTEDVPVAAGFGEAGPAPRPVVVMPEAPAAPPPLPPAPPPRAEPLRPEPVRAEPPRPEPVRAEPPRPEPVRAEPARAEPPPPPKADRRPGAKPPPPMLVEEFEAFGVEAEDKTDTLRPSPRRGSSKAPPVAAPPVVAPPVVAPPVVAPPEPALPVASPPPAAAAPVAPAEAAAAGTTPPVEEVLAVEEAQWQLEVSRPAQLVQAGWMVSGEVLVGNHRGAQVTVPEVRAFPGQAFLATDYYRLHVRGRKGRVELAHAGEARVVEGGRNVERSENLDLVTLEIIRRDATLEPDFDIVLRFEVDPSLPDPRSRLLAVDHGDRLVSALFTVGCPLRAERVLQLGPITATANFDGANLHLSDYLATYRTPTGAFRPFFVKEGGRPFRTMPEDGSPVSLAPGDSLIAGLAVYRFQVS